MTPAERHRELCNTYPAVATYWLPGTTLASIVARDDTGAVKCAELRNSDGNDELEPDVAIDALVEARRSAQRAEELATLNLAAYLRAHRGVVNFAELERRSGIGRSTLYWLADQTAAAA